MSIFDKAVDKLSYDDIKELQDAGVKENITLEFKQDVASPTARNRLIEQISALANTFGGWIVVGVSEHDGPGGSAQLSPTTPDSAFRQSVFARVKENIYPPCAILVSDAITDKDDGDKCYYVIHVPQSPSAPHFLTRRGGCYVRYADERLGYKDGLATLSDMSYLMDRRKEARAHSAHLLDSCRKVEDVIWNAAGQVGGPLTCFSWRVVPELAIPGSRCIAAIRTAAQSIKHTDCYELLYSEESSAERKLVLRETKSALEKTAGSPSFLTNLLQVGLDGEIAYSQFMRFGSDEKGRTNLRYPELFGEYPLYLWDLVKRSSELLPDAGRYVCTFETRNAPALLFDFSPKIRYSRPSIGGPLADFGMTLKVVPWAANNPEAQLAFLRDAAFEMYLGFGLPFGSEFPWLESLKHMYEQGYTVSKLLQTNPSNIDPDDIPDSTLYSGWA